MKRLRSWGSALLTDDSGVTAIEYALIAGLIAVVIAASVVVLGGNLKALFDRAASCFPAGNC